MFSCICIVCVCTFAFITMCAAEIHTCKMHCTYLGMCICMTSMHWCIWIWTRTHMQRHDVHTSTFVSMRISMHICMHMLCAMYSDLWLELDIQKRILETVYESRIHAHTNMRIRQPACACARFLTTTHLAYVRCFPCIHFRAFKYQFAFWCAHTWLFICMYIYVYECLCGCWRGTVCNAYAFR
jgi:hypothetical protein